MDPIFDPKATSNLNMSLCAWSWSPPEILISVCPTYCFPASLQLVHVKVGLHTTGSSSVGDFLLTPSAAITSSSPRSLAGFHRPCSSLGGSRRMRPKNRTWGTHRILGTKRWCNRTHGTTGTHRVEAGHWSFGFHMYPIAEPHSRPRVRPYLRTVDDFFSDLEASGLPQRMKRYSQLHQVKWTPSCSGAMLSLALLEVFGNLKVNW